MDMNEPLIELRGLYHGYSGKQQVLRSVNFRLAPGDRVGLTGPNGAGKTTLLHLIVGLLRPTAGDILVAGVERRREADFLEVRRRVGLLFQDPDDQLFCTTVAEDLAFGPFNLGLARDEVAQRVDGVLEALAIEHLRERVTYRLSEGEKRLVSLGTLLTMAPEALLLDEPTSGLDDAARARLLDLLRELPQAMLIVSHDHEFMNELATRRLHLSDGRLRDVR